MSISFRLLTRARACELFDGRLEEFGTREYVHPTQTTTKRRCITDGSIASEYEPQYWGFDTMDEWDAAQKKWSMEYRKAERKFHRELLKYLRGERQSEHHGAAKISRWHSASQKSSLLLSSRLLDQAPQGRVHDVFEVGGSETGAAELQLGDEAPEKNAALLYRYAVGGSPDGPKLRIGQCEHAAMVSPARWMSSARNNVRSLRGK